MLTIQRPTVSDVREHLRGLGREAMRTGRPTYYKKVRPLRVAITESGWLKILALMRKLKCSQADAVCAAMETVKIEDVRLPDP